MRLSRVSAGYGGKAVFSDFSRDILKGQRVAVIGPNGAGKSTLLKTMLGQLPPLAGSITKPGGLVISCLPQLSDQLSGTPGQFADTNGIPRDRYLTMLRKLDFPREAFERPMESYSLGQRKKALVALSLSQQAHLYVWDEPLNYIDVESREQIEAMLTQTDATLIFVEHDQRFVETVATDIIVLEKSEP